MVISILPGTFDEMEADVHLPERLNIWQSVGDTAGPGGMIRALPEEIRKLVQPHTENHFRTLKAAETFDRDLLLEAFRNDPNTAAKCTDAAQLRKLIDDMIAATAAYLPAGWQ